MKTAIGMVVLVSGLWTARPGDAFASDSLVVVMIATAGQSDAVQALHKALLAQTSDFDVRFKTVWLNQVPVEPRAWSALVRDTAHEENASLVFWCNLSDAEPVLYMIFPQSHPQDGLISRPLSGSGSGGLIETIALILRSTIASLPGPAPEKTVVRAETDAEKVGNEKEAPAIHRNRYRLFHTDLAYTYTAESDQSPSIHGATLFLGIRISVGLYYVMGYSYFSPVIETRVPYRLEMDRHPLWMGVRFVSWLENFNVGAQVALGMDVVSVSSESTSAWIAAQTEWAEVQISLVPLFRAGYLAWDVADFFLAAGVEIPTHRFRYASARTLAAEVRPGAWPVHPMAMAGVSFGFP